MRIKMGCGWTESRLSIRWPVWPHGIPCGAWRLGACGRRVKRVTTIGENDEICTLARWLFEWPSEIGKFLGRRGIFRDLLGGIFYIFQLLVWSRFIFWKIRCILLRVKILLFCWIGFNTFWENLCGIIFLGWETLLVSIMMTSVIVKN